MWDEHFGIDTIITNITRYLQMFYFQIYHNIHKKKHFICHLMINAPITADVDFVKHTSSLVETSSKSKSSRRRYHNATYNITQHNM